MIARDYFPMCLSERVTSRARRRLSRRIADLRCSKSAFNQCPPAVTSHDGHASRGLTRCAAMNRARGQSRGVAHHFAPPHAKTKNRRNKCSYRFQFSQVPNLGLSPCVGDVRSYALRLISVRELQSWRCQQLSWCCLGWCCPAWCCLVGGCLLQRCRCR